MGGNKTPANLGILVLLSELLDLFWKGCHEENYIISSYVRQHVAWANMQICLPVGWCARVYDHMRNKKLIAVRVGMQDWCHCFVAPSSLHQANVGRGPVKNPWAHCMGWTDWKYTLCWKECHWLPFFLQRDRISMDFKHHDAISWWGHWSEARDEQHWDVIDIHTLFFIGTCPTWCCTKSSSHRNLGEQGPTLFGDQVHGCFLGQDAARWQRRSECLSVPKDDRTSDPTRKLQRAHRQMDV